MIQQSPGVLSEDGFDFSDLRNRSRHRYPQFG
jgi:hypothetical protein